MATTVTSVLESIWADEAEPIILAALSASGPLGAAIAFIMKIPVVGSILTYLLNNAVDGMISTGVIDVKVGIISFMSDAAKAKWADELTILNQVQAAGGVLSAEQQAAYDQALQSIVQSHSTVVNA